MQTNKHEKKWPTWKQEIIWEWCPKCSISWHLGDKPQCMCDDWDKPELHYEVK